MQYNCKDNGRGGGIRTPDGLAPMLVFKTSAFNHSATPPQKNDDLVDTGYSFSKTKRKCKASFAFYTRKNIF